MDYPPISIGIWSMAHLAIAHTPSGGSHNVDFSDFIDPGNYVQYLRAIIGAQFI
jgi:hypothetical protein